MEPVDAQSQHERAAIVWTPGILPTRNHDARLRLGIRAEAARYNLERNTVHRSKPPSELLNEGQLFERLAAAGDTDPLGTHRLDIVGYLNRPGGDETILLVGDLPWRGEIAVSAADSASKRRPDVDRGCMVREIAPCRVKQVGDGEAKRRG